MTYKQEVQFSSSAKIHLRWPDFKVTCATKHIHMQYIICADSYMVFALDDILVYTCTLILPDHSAEFPFDADYSREQNDIDFAEFESVFKTDANKPVLPRNYDGRQIIQPVTLGSGQWHYWHGVGDADGVLGGGQHFMASKSTQGEETVTWEYRDPVWIAGGSLKYIGAALGDWVRLTIFAPASPVVPNPTNTGNCHIIFGVIVPSAGGNTGEYDVDLNTAVPVPTSDFEPYSGYWNYTLPANMRGRGTITPGNPGTSKYHLIAGRLNLDGFVRDEMLLGDGESYYEPQNINVSLCLPGWQFECIIHNDTGDHNLQVVWRVLMSRYWTTL